MLPSSLILFPCTGGGVGEGEGHAHSDDRTSAGKNAAVHCGGTRGEGISFYFIGSMRPGGPRRAYRRTRLNNAAVNLQIVPHLLSRFLCLLTVAARPFHIWMIPFLVLGLSLAAVYGLLGIWLCLFWIGFLEVVLTVLSTWTTNMRKFPKSRALL